jgi:hypothetical protein
LAAGHFAELFGDGRLDLGHLAALQLHPAITTR